jgi:hypothetical protein
MDFSQRLEALVGTWQHLAPWDSDDYLAEYVISIENGAPVVTARDLNDGEEFVISEARWDGKALTFRSLMPSTRREGINEFSLTPSGELQTRFTFTVVERLRRVAG